MASEKSDIEKLDNVGYVGLLVKSSADQFLLVRRRNDNDVYGGSWSIPSRKRRPLESADVASLDAFHKDTTVTLKKSTKHRFIDRTMHDNGFYYVYLYVVDKPFRIWPSSKKYIEFKWFDADKLPANITPEVRSAIDVALKYRNV